MRIIEDPNELKAEMEALRNEGHTIGFVPTMGALHAGHISLISSAVQSNSIVVCSIFVNPTQFNNTEDLAKYPRTLESDRIMLETAGCHVLFLPSEKAIYADEQDLVVDFKGLDTKLEGASRPGHFIGVARIVKLLFDAVKPDNAYFGLKDFQQCRIIESLVKSLELKIKLNFMPTLRESDGLAMSSRNRRLSAAQRQAAPIIYKALKYADEKSGQQLPEQITEQCIKLIESGGTFKVDYFVLADAETLEPILSPNAQKKMVALTAVYAGEVRLIDNLPLSS